MDMTTPPPASRVRSTRDNRTGTVTPSPRYPGYVYVRWDDGSASWDAPDTLEVVGRA